MTLAYYRNNLGIRNSASQVELTRIPGVARPAPLMRTSNLLYPRASPTSVGRFNPVQSSDRPFRRVKCLHRDDALGPRCNGRLFHRARGLQGRNSSSHFRGKNGRDNGRNCRFEVTLHSSPFSLCPLEPAAATLAPRRPVEGQGKE